MAKPRLILFNGPRHSGKDTAALHLEQARNAYHFKFSAPIKAAIKAAFQLTDEEVLVLESIKTEPTEILLGKSYVETQISFSEEWAKCFWSPYFFGLLAAQVVRKELVKGQRNLYVCSDSGFSSEAQAVVDLFGKENVLLVKIYRDGKTFAGDSRDYIDLDGVTTISLTNNWNVDYYRKEVEHIADSWLSPGPATFQF